MRFSAKVWSLLLAAGLIGPAMAQAASRLNVVKTESIPGDDAELQIEVVEQGTGGESTNRLPARVTITDSGKKHPDGSGRGVYADGRFFVDGQFTVKVPAGETQVLIQCGPHTVPLDEKVTAVKGAGTQLRVSMERWFDPQKLGWYCGDNHVHTQHDRKTAIRVGPEYTALQARANDLAFITEADTEITSEMGREYDTETFLYRAAPEIRPGPFVGHLNTPGISHPLPPDRYQQLVKRPLPRQSLHAAVAGRGSVCGGDQVVVNRRTPSRSLV